MIKTPLAQTSHKAAAPQTYRFDFGSDDIIYSVSFKGSIQKPELRWILESVRGTLYKNCGRAIRSYLDSQNLSYPEFTVCEKLTEDRIPVKFADRLLHDSSCSAIDQCIGNTAVYYGIMDYRHESKNGCEGCYYAIAKISSAQNSLSEYHIISQTFSHDASGENEWSHFAIRKSTSSHSMVTLDKEYSYPVLAAFGCVDMIGLLINITGITTKQQAAELANI